MELYIFDETLNFKGNLDNFNSLRWSRKYYKCGEFELHCALTPAMLSLLTKGNIIYKKDDPEGGFINYRQLTQDQTGKEILIVKGQFLTGYLNRRIIWGTEILRVTAETAMRTIVNDSSITPVDTNRVIPNLILGSIQSFAEAVDYQVSYANLGDELENLSNTSDLGHRVNFDVTNKKLIFNVYKGLDRSIEQSINPRCLFSKDFENVLDQEYIESLDNYKNLCLIGGIGEGVDRKLMTVGDAAGLARFEIFADQKSLSNMVDSVAMSDTDYNLLLTGKGDEILAETKEIQTFSSKVLTDRYKIDFDLGDVITYLYKKWNVTVNSRITEIDEIYEESGPQINITFGNNIPTLINKIKRMVR